MDKSNDESSKQLAGDAAIASSVTLSIKKFKNDLLSKVVSLDFHLDDVSYSGAKLALRGMFGDQVIELRKGLLGVFRVTLGINGGRLQLRLHKAKAPLAKRLGVHQLPVNFDLTIKNDEQKGNKSTSSLKALENIKQNGEFGVGAEFNKGNEKEQKRTSAEEIKIAWPTVRTSGSENEPYWEMKLQVNHLLGPMPGSADMVDQRPLAFLEVDGYPITIDAWFFVSNEDICLSELNGGSMNTSRPENLEVAKAKLSQYLEQRLGYQDLRRWISAITVVASEKASSSETKNIGAIRLGCG